MKLSQYWRVFHSCQFLFLSHITMYAVDNHQSCFYEAFVMSSYNPYVVLLTDMKLYPAGINKMQHFEVASKLIQCCLDIVCLLGSFNRALPITPQCLCSWKGLYCLPFTMLHFAVCLLFKTKIVIFFMT